MAQQKKGLKTIKDILDSTNKVSGYGSESLGTKEFGAVFAYNKVVKVKPNSSVIEVSMMIKGVTDMIWSRGQKKPVAAHRVRMAIHGVEQEDVDADELVRRIRKSNAEYADENTYPREELLKMVGGGNTKFFKGKTVFEAEKKVRVEEEQQDGLTVRKTKNVSTYAIVNNRISTDCYMKIWCSCSSYYWTFQWYNVENNIDITGRRMQPYESVKGASAKVGLKNPGHHFGMCKHLLLLLAMLMKEEVISEADAGKNNPVTILNMNMDRFNMLSRIGKDQFKNLMSMYTRDYRTKQKQRRLRSWEPKKKKTFAQKQTNNFTKYKNEFGKGKKK